MTYMLWVENLLNNLQYNHLLAIKLHSMLCYTLLSPVNNSLQSCLLVSVKNRKPNIISKINLLKVDCEWSSYIITLGISVLMESTVLSIEATLHFKMQEQLVCIICALSLVWLVIKPGLSNPKINKLSWKDMLKIN